MLNTEVRNFINEYKLLDNTGFLESTLREQTSLINQVEEKDSSFAFKSILKVNQLNIELQLMKESIKNHLFFHSDEQDVDKINPWDFVVDHYKGYHGCSNIARSSDLSLLLEEGPQGQGSDSMYLLENEFGGNTESNDISIALIETDHDIFLRAITEYCSIATEI